MDQLKNENKEKKDYQKPLLTKVELIAEEAVLSACKEGLLGAGCAGLYTCNLAQGS
jgi:hypothetical protein